MSYMVQAELFDSISNSDEAEIHITSSSIIKPCAVFCVSKGVLLMIPWAVPTKGYSLTIILSSARRGGKNSPTPANIGVVLAAFLVSCHPAPYFHAPQPPRRRVITCQVLSMGMRAGPQAGQQSAPHMHVVVAYAYATMSGSSNMKPLRHQ